MGNDEMGGQQPGTNIEDYGSSDSAGGSGTMSGLGSADSAGERGTPSGGNVAATGGKYSGGTTGVGDTSAGNEGEYFGEFEDTGTGVDLTEEMENTDVRTGLVKGGEEGASGVAGPGQYGGEAGSLGETQ